MHQNMPCLNRSWKIHKNSKKISVDDPKPIRRWTFSKVYYIKLQEFRVLNTSGV